MSGQVTHFAHALALHREHPDTPLPYDGEPYPDEPRHRLRAARYPEDQRPAGADVAAVLDAHCATDAAPHALAHAFDDLAVPIHRNDHIAAAALRADRVRVRRTGRWLVRHATSRNAATVGLALLATGWAEEDIPLIQTIGLLSRHFGSLAAEALQRRHRAGAEALTWLVQRVAGWGRVYVVEAICQQGMSAPARHWLLRHACDGDFLNGYFAGRLAAAAHLHEAFTADTVDDALVDHAGRLLRIMAGCRGMGETLAHYPPAPAVLAAHATRLGRQEPTARRYTTAAALAARLVTDPEDSGCTPAQRDAVVARYVEVLNRSEWQAAVRADVGRDPEFYDWLAETAGTTLGLRALADVHSDRADGP